MRKSVYICDFETTVYEGQDHTEVWAAAAVRAYTEQVEVFNSIDKFFHYFTARHRDALLYFHNLKFDGEFILQWLYRNPKYKLAGVEKDLKTFTWKDNKEMQPGDFKYLISDTGSWYSIRIQEKGFALEIWDSLKIMPFSVKNIGPAFDTIRRKSRIDYKGYREANRIISPEEKEYIKNDVLVVKEAIEMMYNAGHSKMTIGSCCLAEFKRTQWDYGAIFPDLTQIVLPPEYGSTNADEYIRRAYGGGWCYYVPEKAGKVLKNGIVLDVNSLYPSQMHSDGGRYYPIGSPAFFKGKSFKRLQWMTESQNYYYYIRIRCNFFLKKNKLPFIHIRNNPLYNANDNLVTNYIKTAKGWTSKYYEPDGTERDVKVTMTLSGVDYKLFLEHYRVMDLEILDGCYFHAEKGIFDDYINKYRELKENAKTKGDRTIAKLFLNNLYGKLAASTRSDFKVAYLKENGTLGFNTYVCNDKKPGYIAAGAAVTSYARDFTIRAAQANYHGPDKPGLVYSDTDSIHCDNIDIEDIQGVKIDDRLFNHWKHESSWDEALFVRQKTYVEHVTHENGEPVESPYYDIKCAGMNERCKKLFIDSMTGNRLNEYGEPDAYTEEELEYLETPRELADFKIGMTVPSKLIAHRLPGGLVLEETTFKLHERGRFTC